MVGKLNNHSGLVKATLERMQRLSLMTSHGVSGIGEARTMIKLVNGGMVGIRNKVVSICRLRVSKRSSHQRVSKHSSHLFRHQPFAVSSESRRNDRVRTDTIDLKNLNKPILLPALDPPDPVSLHRSLDKLEHCRSKIDASIAIPSPLALALNNRRNLLRLVLHQLQQVSVRRPETDDNLRHAQKERLCPELEQFALVLDVVLLRGGLLGSFELDPGDWVVGVVGFRAEDGVYFATEDHAGAADAGGDDGAVLGFVVDGFGIAVFDFFAGCFGPGRA
jgi:hypothetical protein